jgi:hypothetical protein
MRLGVPFIAPRQLGAVESKSGRPFLPSVVWRTGQSGAHRTVSGARFPSLNGEADRWRPWSRWRTGHVRCTPDSPVPPSDRWLGHVSRADSAADRWLGRPLAHRTVRCTPDSPVNFSRTPPPNSRERPLDQTPACTTGHCPVHHRTLSGAPPDSPVLPDSAESWLLEPRQFQFDFSCFHHLDTIY